MGKNSNDNQLFRISRVEPDRDYCSIIDALNKLSIFLAFYKKQLSTEKS